MALDDDGPFARPAGVAQSIEESEMRRGAVEGLDVIATGTVPSREFPFSAIAGQEEMKLALMLVAIDPSIGGVLALGDRGTGKSTAVRALAALLPPIRVAASCPYNCDPEHPSGACEVCSTHPSATARRALIKPVPMVDLPLGATEDRVVGALDIERALVDGVKVFQPGLLARANRGFLYIDEVNLLEDHLVDLLIDVAASGENVVEREGLSVRHPARFVLVGSGNPEEGELRPQLLDRFGLSADVRTPLDIDTRVTIVERRDAFERHRERFLETWQPAEEALRRTVIAARERLGSTDVPATTLRRAAELCVRVGTDGLRGELTLMRAARALASLEGDTVAGDAHLRRVAPACLRHRLRRSPLDDAGSTVRIERAVSEIFTA